MTAFSRVMQVVAAVLLLCLFAAVWISRRGPRP